MAYRLLLLLFACIASAEPIPYRFLGFKSSLVNFQFEVDDRDSTVFIALSGPSDKWFGVGFNASTMKDTYTIIVYANGAVEERVLGDHSSGKVLDPTVVYHSTQVVGGVRTVFLSRPSVGKSQEYLNFTTDSGKLQSMPFICAHGAGPVFRSHGPQNSAAETIQFSPISRATAQVDSLVRMRLDFYDNDVDGDTDIVRIQLTGPSGLWFGAGFGADSMSNTYAIIVEANHSVSERKLGIYSPGDQLASSLTVLNVTEQRGELTVTMTRRMKGITKDHYSFDINSYDIPYICAIGTGPAFSEKTQHNSTGRATGHMVARSDGVVSGADATGTVPVTLSLNSLSDTAEFTMTGPEGKWFAVGFNATNMSDAPWTVVVLGNGGVSLYKLGDHKIGQMLPMEAALQVVSNEVVSGKRVIAFSRPLVDPADSEAFNFSVAFHNLPYISAIGTSGDLGYHASRSTSKMVLEPPRSFTGSAYFPKFVTPLNVSVHICEVDNTVLVTMVGSANHWMGVGFNATSMGDNPYAIVVNGTGDVTEMTLVSRNHGPVLNRSVSIKKNEVVNGVRTVVLERGIKPTSSASYDFTPHSLAGFPLGFNVIGAVGTGGVFSYHGGSNRGTSPIGQQLSPSTPAPSPLPTQTPSPPMRKCDPSTLAVDPSNPAFTYQCVLVLATGNLKVHYSYTGGDTVAYALETAAFSSGYVAFSYTHSCQKMAQADAVIGSCFPSCKIETYLVEGYTTPTVDNSMTLVNSSQETVSGRSIFRFARKLSNGGTITVDPNKDMCANYALNTQVLELQGHGYGLEHRGSFTLNLVSGASGIQTKGPLYQKRINHGIILLITWCWIIPLSVILKRFGKPVFGLGISQFYGHAFLGTSGMVLTIFAVAYAYKNSFGPGLHYHAKLGLAVLILCCLNPVVGLLGYIFVRNPQHPKRWVFNYIHWLVGRTALLLGAIQVFLGIDTLNKINETDTQPYLLAAVAGLVATASAFLLLTTSQIQLDKERLKLQEAAILNPNEADPLLS